MRLLIILFLLLIYPVSGYETSAQIDTFSYLPEPDSLINSEMNSEQSTEFGDDYNALFSSDFGGIDTSNWCNSKINSGRFDYKTMLDTLKLVLIDSSFSRFYVHPFPNYITSPFGPRGGYWHFGTDVKVRTGDTVRCAFDGIVRVVMNDRYGYGKAVVVRHHNGLETIYGHLSKATVTLNQKLKAGETIGLGGNTGRSTGSHLHFEIRFCGEPFDPALIIDFDNYSLKSDTMQLSRGNFEYLTALRKTIFHKVRKGENLGVIARRYGTTVKKLCAYNGITSRTVLKIGRRLVVRKEITPSTTITLQALGTSSQNIE
jgi:hypothetical protein